MPGRLILCATPIGNLEDISFRVLRALKEADLIACEDTRNSIKLLNHFDIHTPMTSYHEYNKYDKGEELVAKMLAGSTVALITDAGTPGISDPGEVVARMAEDAGIEVTSLPGPAACITALTLSGLPTRRFVFEAFLPSDKKERRAVLDDLRDETRTIVLYEAPHHLRKTLAELMDVLGGARRISLCRELTKAHEEVIRTTIGEACGRYETRDPRGEYVLVIEGKSRAELREEKEQSWQEIPIEEHLQRYLDQGLSEKEAMKRTAADRGCPKRDIYSYMVSRKQGEKE